VFTPDTSTVSGFFLQFNQGKLNMKSTQSSISNVTPSALLLVAALSVSTHALAAPYAYVPNQIDGTVSVIDIATDAVSYTLPSKGRLGKKIQGLALDASAKNMFVVDADGGVLQLVDLATKKMTKKIAVGDSPETANLSPDGLSIAVCLEEEHAVAFIDVASLKLAYKVKTQGKNPEHCVYSPDGKWLLASNEESGDVDVLDLANKKSVARIKSAGHPRGIGFLPNGKFAYIANESVGVVEVIDSNTWQVVTAITTGLRANGIAIAPDGSKVYVSNGGDGTVSVITTQSNTVSATIKVGKRPWNMAITADGSKLYVANGRSNNVSVIDTASQQVVKTIKVGKLPWGVVIR
jgi:YVTN family beta-propeller protein